MKASSGFEIYFFFGIRGRFVGKRRNKHKIGFKKLIFLLFLPFHPS